MNPITDSARQFANQLLAHLVVPVFVLDAEQRVVTWNHACEQLTGVMAAELIGTRNHWRAFYDEPRPCLADIVVTDRLGEIAALYADSEQVITLEHGVHAANWCAMPRRGRHLYLAIDVRPVYDEGGRLIAAVETLRDMTAQITLQHEATHDGLTSLLNRRAFDGYLPREWKRAAHEGQPLSLIMVDIDHFKRYNDTHGHLRGDECLCQVAAALQEATRPGDLTIRYGGEEFTVILPGAQREAAARVAERIKQRIAALALPHPLSEWGVVSVSMGVATTVPQVEVDATTLLAAADAALYRAKHAGRNRFFLASGPL